MKYVAVCVFCGHMKSEPSERCTVCQKTPASHREKAQSFMLSSFYEIDGELRALNEEELFKIGESIRSGTYSFNEAELAEVEGAAKSALSQSPIRLAADVLRWLFPVLLLLMVVLWLVVR